MVLVGRVFGRPLSYCHFINTRFRLVGKQHTLLKRGLAQVSSHLLCRKFLPSFCDVTVTEANLLVVYRLPQASP